jgi:hypothetical protein
MGRGKGVVLEADVGFKDGKGKGPFSPTSGSHPASHVDESSQVPLCTCFVIGLLHQTFP